MILVDTSVWVEHMRHGDESLSALLLNESVLAHPFVIGELALGGAKPRMLADLQNLPSAEIATDGEVLDLIQRQSLAGRGIGYIDAHLLASTMLTSDTLLWTFDRNLKSAANELGLSR